jgi:hypothetical protein
MELWQELGYRSYDDYALDNGLPTESGQQDRGIYWNGIGMEGATQGPLPPQTTTTALSMPQDPGATGTGGGNGLEPGYPKPFEGKLYNTPQELAAAVHASALVKYNENSKVIEDSYKKGLLTYDEYLKMARDNADTVKKTRDQNLSNIQGYFNKIAPDAVQSEQSTMQGKTNDEYSKIQANTGDLFGGRGASELAGTDLSAYANDLSTTGKIARGISGVNDAKAKSVKNNDDYMNSVNWDNFAMLNPAPTSANTGLTDFLQNLAAQVYAPGQTGGGITGSTASQTVDPYGNPVKKTDEFGNPIK